MKTLDELLSKNTGVKTIVYSNEHYERLGLFGDGMAELPYDEYDENGYDRDGYDRDGNHRDEVA